MNMRSVARPPIIQRVQYSRQTGEAPFLRGSVSVLILFATWTLTFFLSPILAVEAAPSLTQEVYRGWNTQCLSNGLVQVHVVPEIGGRVVQFKVGKQEFYWVNPQLAGKHPPASGLASDGGWLNYGGDKLWPAPQGWDSPEQWPGPPDAVLDGQPYTFEVLPAKAGEAALKLTSGEDHRSGIQFSRVIRVCEGSTRVAVEATMKNIDSRPRRWGIWAHTQLDAVASDDRKPNQLMRAWCPVNPRSHFLEGYDVVFGAKDNPSFRTDWRRGLVEVDYRYQVGKIAVDSPAGWVATVDGSGGAVFVQRFTFEPDRAYPDNATVEFWHNGIGKIHAYNREMEFSDDPDENPFVFESEMLSPFFEMQPGESATWKYEWYATNVGGDYPVVGCNELGVVAEPLEVSPVKSGGDNRCRITGRFGVFALGKAWLRFADESGSELQRVEIEQETSPLRPLVLNVMLPAPTGAMSVELLASGPGTQGAAALAHADLLSSTIPGQWSKDKAWNWYQARPWLVGCNFLPSTVVNDVEMWQAETFDTATIDRELGWARDLGFNTVRVFLNYVVWKADPDGLKRRFARFLRIAASHGISVMPILFDNCNFAGRVAAAGKQLQPIPGVHNSQWVSSPPLAMVTDRQAWSQLERYTKDMVGYFGRDRRIVIWDLYNEPGNSGMGDKSLPLAEAVSAWAREAKPQQPLTIAVWADLNGAMSRRIMDLSDVVSFHGYDRLGGIQDKLEICRCYGRPILCTEWLHRQSGNTVETILPTFQAQRVGCYNWGLVYGRTQTYMPWGSKPGDPVPAQWQHDLLDPNGKPFRARELKLIRELVDKSRAAP